MKTSLIQGIYAFIMTNPCVNTREIADQMNIDLKLVSSWLQRAELKGQVRAVTRGKGRNRPNCWVVTNRPVKFNTGESVRKVSVVNNREQTVQKIKQEIKRLTALAESL